MIETHEDGILIESWDDRTCAVAGATCGGGTVSAQTVITHKGHEYRPATEVQPREGDLVALLDRLREGYPWAVIEGPAERVGSDLMLGVYMLRDEHGWSLNPVRIVQPALPYVSKED